ncbi:hypothetical protein ACQBAU_01025 [Propionibacteriaceae bacterium Y2011]
MTIDHDRPDLSLPTEPLPRPPAAAMAVGAIGFVGLYLARDLIIGPLQSGPAPLPTASGDELLAWLRDNPLAQVVGAAVQFVSVAFLALFATAVGRMGGTYAQTRAARTAMIIGWLAAGLMILSSVMSWVLVGIAPTVGVEVAEGLRTANFIAGGTAHVVALGVFVLATVRIPGVSKPLRVFGWIAAAPAVLSLVSLLVYEGNALILFGRLLCMAWTVVATISLVRRSRDRHDEV